MEKVKIVSAAQVATKDDNVSLGEFAADFRRLIWWEPDQMKYTNHNPSDLLSGELTSGRGFYEFFAKSFNEFSAEQMFIMYSTHKYFPKAIGALAVRRSFYSISEDYEIFVFGEGTSRFYDTLRNLIEPKIKIVDDKLFGLKDLDKKRDAFLVKLRENLEDYDKKFNFTPKVISVREILRTSS
jgi:hypothetical protein